MRGTPTPGLGFDDLHRIIPADAGNTLNAIRCFIATWDHPRGCGEHGVTNDDTGNTQGSSPRMRGTQLIPPYPKTWQRIIPADAGNTMASLMPLTPVQDHPRGCGEHLADSMGKKSTLGSSPRMRGTPDPHFPILSVSGIIPADAGNTYNRNAGALPRRDHPRGCGEYKSLTISKSDSRGSSPRMRGTRALIVASRQHAGIIPADAGNTDGD